ncbi:hypothetical protein CEXT_741891 [Caerostris extrusa]|uniref:Uncharacterized protein n=1 Tax=Caerostris extrusa TaxID=172846 RepID=A0AAV4VFG2_CAEEX|nr:hypothetical protein CEXT_741891 [Caerostris extrusa]
MECGKKHHVILHFNQRPINKSRKKEVKESELSSSTISAPYLATKTLKQISSDEEKNFPIGASVLCNDINVDDALSGPNILEEPKRHSTTTIDILKNAKMSLHK